MRISFISMCRSCRSFFLQMTILTFSLPQDLSADSQLEIPKRCGVSDATADEVRTVRFQINHWSAAGGRSLAIVTTIPLAVHVVRNDDGTADVTDQQIYDQIAVLDSAFATTNFRFELHSIERVSNSAWSNHRRGSPEETQMKQSLAVDPAHVMNLYVCGAPRDEGGGPVLGHATFPWQYAENNNLHGVVVVNGSLPGGSIPNYNEGDSGIHEVGHYLGLYHTFQGGCAIPGDEVDDTPYEETAAGGCPNGRDTCPEIGLDPIDNYLDYTFDNCMNRFTSGQSNRMDSIMALYRPSMVTPPNSTSSSDVLFHDEFDNSQQPGWEGQVGNPPDLWRFESEGVLVEVGRIHGDYRWNWTPGALRLMRSIPCNPFTIETKMNLNFQYSEQGSSQAYLMWMRDINNYMMIGVLTVMDAGPPVTFRKEIAVVRESGGTPIETRVPIPDVNLLFLRIRVESDSTYFYYGFDGLSWQLARTEAVRFLYGEFVMNNYSRIGFTAFDTPNIYGIYSTSTVLFDYFRITAGPRIVFSNQVMTIPGFSIPGEVGGTANCSIPSIANDSSSATVVEARNVSGDVAFIVLEDSLGLNPARYGSFPFPPTPTLLGVQAKYVHPSIGYSGGGFLTIEIRNRSSGKALLRYSIRTVFPPVVLVHGIWSNSDDCFGMMKGDFVGSLWNPLILPYSTRIKLVHNADYRGTSHMSFAVNSQVVPQAISNVLWDARKSGVSAGKVCVVGHSMGGLLARKYLISDGYRDDINRLVTINTPHWGSQGANLLLDPNAWHSNLAYQSVVDVFAHEVGPIEDAVLDLRVGSAELAYLNGPHRNRHVVPTHAVHTTSQLDFGWFSVFLNPLARTFFGACYQTPINVLTQLYNEPNDVIVSSNSQIGGVPQNTGFTNQFHSGAATNVSIIQRVKTILWSRSSWYLTNNGFQGPSSGFQYNFPPCTTPDSHASRRPGLGRGEGGQIEIVDPPSGTVITAGQSVNIAVVGQTPVSQSLLIVGNKSIGVQSSYLGSPSGSYVYQVPVNAVGQIVVCALGADSNDILDRDTIALSVLVNAPLDSIECSTRSLYVPLGSKASVGVTGHYADAIRRTLSYESSLSYVSSNTNVARIVDGQYVEGVDTGETTVSVSYMGRAAFVTVTVVPETTLQIPPSTPNPIYPQNQTGVPPNGVLFRWSASQFAGSYGLQVSLSSNFSELAFEQPYVIDTFIVVSSLLDDTTYYWRVKASNMGGSSGWSSPWSFYTNSALPIVLASFTGHQIPSGGVLLQWMTLSEINNFGFYVERKLTSDSLFQMIPNSFQPGHGTTNVPQHYEFLDTTVFPSVWLYRLRQVDLDGSVHHSFSIQLSVVTAVQEDVPTEFQLTQNFPNPFNPTTTIRYGLPIRSKVRLELYNVLGQRVVVLFDDEQEAGFQTLAWNGNVASGVYLYRIEAIGVADPNRSFTQVKKMLLLK